MNSTVRERSSAITVEHEMNTEQSTHNPPAVSVVQVAPRSERDIRGEKQE